jgi:hypothetical protein
MSEAPLRSHPSLHKFGRLAELEFLFLLGTRRSLHNEGTAEFTR